MNFIHNKLNQFDLHLRREAVNEFQCFKEAITGKSALGDTISWGNRLVSLGSGVSLELIYRIERVFEFVAVSAFLVVSATSTLILSPSLICRGSSLSNFVKESISLAKLESKLVIETFSGFLISPMVLSTTRALQALIIAEKNPQKKFEYLMMAATRGDNESLAIVGEAFLKGSYGEIELKNRSEEGIAYLQQAGEKDNKKALKVLSKHYIAQNQNEKVLPLLTKAINNGPRVALKLAEEIVKSDSVLALTLYKLALKNEVNGAKSCLVFSCLNKKFTHIPSEEQINEGISLVSDELKKDKPDLDCLNMLGLHYLHNPFTELEAKKIFERGIALGSDDSKINLARYFEDSKIDLDKARALYKEVADHDDVQAMIYYAEMLYKGIGGEQDVQNAKAILVKAKENAKDFLGDVIYHLAYIKYNCEEYEPTTRAQLLSELQKDLKQSLENLYDIYEDQVNNLQTIVSLEIQARNSDIDAINKLITIDTVRSNKKLLVDLYKLGDEWGDQNCSYQLGLAYLNADGIEKDEIAAFELFNKAADLEHENASLEVAGMHYFGRGTKKDEAAAIQRYQELAESKDPKIANEAKYLLAYIFSKGSDTHYNLNQAQKLLKELSKVNYPNALNLLNEVEKMKKESTLLFSFFN